MHVTVDFLVAPLVPPTSPALALVDLFCRLGELGGGKRARRAAEPLLSLPLPRPLPVPVLVLVLVLVPVLPLPPLLLRFRPLPRILRLPVPGPTPREAAVL